jgi:hypothetical protein
VTQALHLVAITVFVGAILIVDVRLLAWRRAGPSPARLARGAQRVLLWTAPAVLATGFLQFATNAGSYYGSSVFAIKMGVLAAALVYTATVRRWVAAADADRLPPWVPRAVAAMSLILWMSVTIGGRLIAFR